VLTPFNKLDEGVMISVIYYLSNNITEENIFPRLYYFYEIRKYLKTNYLPSISSGHLISLELHLKGSYLQFHRHLIPSQQRRHQILS